MEMLSGPIKTCVVQGACDLNSNICAVVCYYDFDACKILIYKWSNVTKDKI